MAQTFSQRNAIAKTANDRERKKYGMEKHGYSISLEVSKQYISMRQFHMVVYFTPFIWRQCICVL